MFRPTPARLLAAALLFAAPAAAQQGAGLPEAYLHAAEAGGSHDTRETGLSLRPNVELPFFAYVRNPGEDPRKAVTVVLAKDKDGQQPVAKGTVPEVKGRESVRVRLAPVAPPAPPAPPPAAAKPGDPPAAPAGTAVPDRLYLLTTAEGEDKRVLAGPVQELAVEYQPPANFLDLATQPTFRPVADGHELTLAYKDRMAGGKKFPGPPAKVRLDLRPALMPALIPDPAKAGTYETVVPPGATEVVLAAKGLRFRNGRPEGRFAVSVDGFDRAYVFDVGPEGNNATPIQKGFARLDLPRYAVPGKPLAVRAEVFLEQEAKPRLTFQRADAGQPQDLLPGAGRLREVTRTLRVGEAGELLLTAAVKDWVVAVDTAGVYGERAFTLTADPPVDEAKAAVVFDDTPPAAGLLAQTRPSYVGTTLRVVADVADAESGVTEVLFFLGEPPLPDGKVPPGSEAVKGLPLPTPKGGKPAAGRYYADFLLPDTKGRVKVGVRATNGAGLTTLVEPATVLVVEPPKPKAPRTVGDIKVTVTQGSTPERPQPGLPVELRTAAGVVVDSQTTDDKGEAKFVDLPPGGYVVTSAKLSDGVARAVKAVSVKADKQAEVALELKR